MTLGDRIKSLLVRKVNSDIPNSSLLDVVEFPFADTSGHNVDSVVI